MADQQSIFGEPGVKPSQSQWFTPPWLARKLASWVPRGARVLDPSCGRGNLLEALLRSGHIADNLSGIELDAEWAAFAREQLRPVPIVQGDFLLLPYEPDAIDVVLMNPPFEDNAHMRFVLRALEIAPTVIGVFPVSFQFSRERDRSLWASRAVVTRRATLPERVDYGGEQSPSFDSVALRIERRPRQRGPGEVRQVLEEVWAP